MNKLALLLKREYWEHRGGFLWAPVWTCVTILAVTVFGILTAEVVGRRNSVHFGFSLDKLRTSLDANDMIQAGNALDMVQLMFGAVTCLVLFFVLFFYLLGALYDDRRDRSVLFWKSLPISDRDTVVSKGISALLVAPILALAASLITMVGFMLILSVVVLLHGGNPITLLWGPGSPLSVVGAFLIGIAVYALWALPTAGWLLLCSAWARSKPFLWAIMIPVFSGIFVSWFDITKLFNLDSSWYWANIVGRVLLGTFPGADIAYRGGFEKDIEDMDGTLHAFSASNALESLSTPDIWIGAVAGLVMIYGAIRLRRWRDDN